MEEENKITIITEELKKRKTTIKYDYCCNPQATIKGIKKKFKGKKIIAIFDITHEPQKPKNKFFLVNDHINKTGKNPLISNSPIEFIDLTKLYKKNKKGITTISLGEKYKNEKHHHKIPSTTLCLIAILCKKITPEAEIQGVLINL